jgi:hypothetical protein
MVSNEYSENIIPVFYWKMKELWYVYDYGKGYKNNFKCLCYMLFNGGYNSRVGEGVKSMDIFIKRFRSIDEIIYLTGEYYDYTMIPEAMMNRDLKWAVLHCRSVSYIEALYARIILNGIYIIV